MASPCQVWSMLKGDSSWATGGDKQLGSFGFGTNTQSLREEDGDMQFTISLRAAKPHSIVVKCSPPEWALFPLKSCMIVNYPKQTFGGYFSNRFLPL